MIKTILFILAILMLNGAMARADSNFSCSLYDTAGASTYPVPVPSSATLIETAQATVVNGEASIEFMHQGSHYLVNYRENNTYPALIHVDRVDGVTEEESIPGLSMPGLPVFTGIGYDDSFSDSIEVAQYVLSCSI